MSLILTFDNGGEELMMEGVVRWRCERGDSGSEVGIEFTNVTPSVRDRLTAKLAAHPEITG